MRIATGLGSGCIVALGAASGSRATVLPVILAIRSTAPARAFFSSARPGTSIAISSMSRYNASARWFCPCAVYSLACCCSFPTCFSSPANSRSSAIFFLSPISAPSWRQRNRASKIRFSLILDWIRADGFSTGSSSLLAGISIYPLKEGLQHHIGDQPRTYGAIHQQSGETVSARPLDNNRKGGYPSQNRHPDQEQFLHGSSPEGAIYPLIFASFFFRNRMALGVISTSSSSLIYDIQSLSLIHISEPTRRTPISYAVF